MQTKYGYGHQSVSEKDIEAMTAVLRSEYLTCGPAVPAFEQALCRYTGAKYCVVVSNATAGLHLAAMAAGLGEGDEAITSPITFLSSANCVCFTGATPVFADIEPETANIDPMEIRKKITPRTKVIIPVHFAGQSCDMEAIAGIAKEHGLLVIEDAAHAIGSEYKGHKVGSCAYSDMVVFSFHPVKNITTGEGGAIMTNSRELYDKLCALRSHGVHKEGAMRDTWEYEMRELGYNCRMTDLQAALGLSQLERLDTFKARRRSIVDYYNEHLHLPHLEEKAFSCACFHLYPILVENRREWYLKARDSGLYLQVHYIPVYRQPYYARFGYAQGDCPHAEWYYERCLSLPLYPALTDEDLEEIVRRLKAIQESFRSGSGHC